MIIYECVNSCFAFNAIISALKVSFAFKCFVWPVPEHLLEACRIGNTQTKHLEVMGFKKAPEICRSQDQHLAIALAMV